MIAGLVATAHQLVWLSQSRRRDAQFTRFRYRNRNCVESAGGIRAGSNAGRCAGRTPGQPRLHPATAAPATLVAPVAPVAAPPIAFTWEALVTPTTCTISPEIRRHRVRQALVSSMSWQQFLAQLRQAGRSCRHTVCRFPHGPRRRSPSAVINAASKGTSAPGPSQSTWLPLHTAMTFSSSKPSPRSKPRPGLTWMRSLCHNGQRRGHRRPTRTGSTAVRCCATAFLCLHTRSARELPR